MMVLLFLGIVLGLIVSLAETRSPTKETRVPLLVSWVMCGSLIFVFSIGLEHLEIAAAVGLVVGAVSAVFARYWIIATVCIVLIVAIAAMTAMAAADLSREIPDLYFVVRLASDLSGALIFFVYPCAGILVGEAIARIKANSYNK